MSPRGWTGTIQGLNAELQLARKAELEGSWTDAQRELLRDTRDRLQRAIRRVCPADMVAHADDIVQLAMLKVMRVIESEALAEGSSPPAASYLWKVAYTTTIDELRKVRSQTNTRNNAAEAKVAAPSSSISPDSAVEGAQLGQAIQGCIDALGLDRRRAVMLHLQGHTVAEAATLLGWTRKRAENLVYRGLADLRGCLSSKGWQP